MSPTETFTFYFFLGGVILSLFIKAFWIRRCINERAIIMKIQIDKGNGEIIFNA